MEERILAILKEDSFGRVELVERQGIKQVRRNACGGRIPGSGILGRVFARRERDILKRLEGIPGIPRFLGQEGSSFFYRSYIEGRQLDETESVGSSYFGELLALLEKVHEAGVAHNDLAKEANILVDVDQRPALVDFQLALGFRNRGGRFFAMLCREDRRHCLKQKARHRPDLLSAQDREALKKKSLPARIWSLTGMKIYHGLTRPLGWRDREGRGMKDISAK